MMRLNPTFPPRHLFSLPLIRILTGVLAWRKGAMFLSQSSQLRRPLTTLLFRSRLASTIGRGLDSSTVARPGKSPAGMLASLSWSSRATGVSVTHSLSLHALTLWPSASLYSICLSSWCRGRWAAGLQSRTFLPSPSSLPFRPLSLPFILSFTIAPAVHQNAGGILLLIPPSPSPPSTRFELHSYLNCSFPNFNTSPPFTSHLPFRLLINHPPSCFLWGSRTWRMPPLSSYRRININSTPYRPEQLIPILFNLSNPSCPSDRGTSPCPLPLAEPTLTRKSALELTWIEKRDSKRLQAYLHRMPILMPTSRRRPRLTL